MSKLFAFFTVGFVLIALLQSSDAFGQGVEEIDIVISGGRIVDGTGAPWYVADIGIKDGEIVRIGRLEDVESPKRIDAKGLVVAPGFIDMMGQTASPMLDNPESAKIF